VLSRADQIVGGRALGADNVGIIIESINESSSGTPVPDGYALSVARSGSPTVSKLPVGSVLDWPKDFLES
jgi:hypothetical protein